MWSENPALYELAKQVCHEEGIEWTDPRTGEVHKPTPKEEMLGRRRRAANHLRKRRALRRRG